jgi:hypothetical protein
LILILILILIPASLKARKNGNASDDYDGWDSEDPWDDATSSPV